jgi:hypothetical protein
MHIRYVINQHHCDKNKDFLHVDQHFYFPYIKTCLWLLFFVLGDKDKRMLLYHAFHQHLGEINKRILTEINKIDL